MYDVVVIGAGPGGYVAAIRAAQLGLKVAVVEAQDLGGVCLNWGCIPTKALLRTAEVYHLLQSAAQFGLSAKDISFDFEKVVARSRDVSKQLKNGVTHLLKKNKVEVISGYGRLQGRGKISVEGPSGTKTIEAKHIILATGARARPLPGVAFDATHIWSSKEAMVPKQFPKKLLIIGSGAIGMEFASFYHTMGASVEVIEMQDQILPTEDKEIAALALKIFRAQGITISTSTTAPTIAIEKGGVAGTLKDASGKTRPFQVDAVIVAIGIVPNTQDLGLQNTKIKLEKDRIVVDQWCETAEPNVFAIGDIIQGPWLAHKASHEGVLVAEKIAGVKGLHPIAADSIPGCVYSLPQIASVGLTEASALAQGYTLKIGRFPYQANGKAIALGETQGLVKTIFDAKTGALLGAHLIGAEVTEMIQGFVVAKNLETTEEELIHTVFPHPTLSEMMHESVLDSQGRPIHY